MSLQCVSLCECVWLCVCMERGPCYYVLLLFNRTAVGASSLQTWHRLPGNCPTIGQLCTSSDQSHGAMQYGSEWGRKTQQREEDCEKVCFKTIKGVEDWDLSSCFKQGVIRLREQTYLEWTLFLKLFEKWLHVNVLFLKYCHFFLYSIWPFLNSMKHYVFIFCF